MTTYVGSGGNASSWHAISLKAEATGSHGISVLPDDPKSHIEEILTWSEYNKSDVAAMLGIARATLYNCIDGENMHPDTANKIAHLHSLVTSYVVRGGDPGSDFMRAKLQDSSKLVDRLSDAPEDSIMREEDDQTIDQLVKRSQKIARAKDQLRKKFG